MNLSQTAQGVITPILEFYRPIPPLAYLPLVIIWFGIGEFAKVLVIFLGILPSIIIATNEGLRSVSPDRSTPRVRSARPALRWCSARASSACDAEHPHRHAHRAWRRLGHARRGELVAARRGFGFMIKGAADFLVTDVVILGILVIAAAAIVMEIGLRVVQRIARALAGSRMIKRHRVSAAPPPPVGVKYHHATEAAGWLYVTGQLPADPARRQRRFRSESRLRPSRRSGTSRRSSRGRASRCRTRCLSASISPISSATSMGSTPFITAISPTMTRSPHARRSASPSLAATRLSKSISFSTGQDRMTAKRG